MSPKPLDNATKLLAQGLRGRFRGEEPPPSPTPNRARRPGRPKNKLPSQDPKGRRGYRRTRDRDRIKRRALRAASNLDDIFPEVKHLEQRAFLVAFAETGNKKEAAQSIDIPLSRVQSRRWTQDLVFQRALKQAEETAADLLESEAFRRAVKGWQEPVGWYQGHKGGMVRRYSDLLLIFLLKGLRPDKYKDRVELKGILGALDMNKLPHEAIERIANGEHPFAVLASLAQVEAQKLGIDLGGNVKGLLRGGNGEHPTPEGSSGGGRP